MVKSQEAIILKTGTFPITRIPQDSRSLDFPQFLFYRTDHTLTGEEIQTLKESGVEILYALRENLYWIRLNNLPPVRVIEKLFEIDEAYKVGVTIDRRSPIQQLRISIAPGLTMREIEGWAAANDFVLLDIRGVPFGLIDIQIHSQSLTNVIQTPWVSYIEPIPIDEEVNYRQLPGERGWGLKSPLMRGLSGVGMTVGIGDGGRLGLHEDLAQNVTDLASFGISNHATQVTGIVTGSGLLDPVFGFGYAPDAKVLVRNFSDILWDAPQYIEDFNLSLTNNSYSANPFDCAYIGDYTGTTTALDAMVMDYPQLLHVFAAGNSGTITCSPYPFRFATIAGGYQSAKNVLTVGAINVTDGATNFSSRGPVDDGRIKPEVVANGLGRFSTINGNNYDSNSGTSFSSPAVMGIATLLYERYRELHNDSLPQSALIKNVICNAADDIGVAGPDFSFGFGRVNGVRAAEILEANHFDSVMVEHNASVAKVFTVPAGIASIDVMLMWSDHPSAPYETVSLVNDLDVLVINPAGDTLRPWVLNNTPAGVALPAIPGIDRSNNYEQITIASPQQGVYTIIVKGYRVPMGPQSAWLSWDLHRSGIVVQSPAGGEVFKPGNPSFPNDRQYIRWDAFGTGSSTFTAEYSTDGGSTWNLIQGNIPAQRRYQEWFVPAIPTAQMRVRITASNGMQDTSAFNAVIMAPPSNLTLSSPCNGYVSANWTSVPGAAYYQLYSLQNEALIPLDTSHTTSVIVEGLQPNDTYRIAVAGVFPSGIAGLRSKAITIIPDGGNNCAWNHDLRIDSIVSPVSGRSFTSSSLTTAETIEVYLSNQGISDASGFSLSYQINNGSIITEIFGGILPAGASQNFTFTTSADLSVTGNYELKVWTTYVSDPFPLNDTIVYHLKHIPNPVVTFPWREDFDTIPDIQILESAIPMAGLNSWDALLNNEGRIRTFAGDPFMYSGSRALTIDASRNAGSSGELVLTLNLQNYLADEDDIRMNFAYMHHEFISEDINDDSIMIRGSDSDPYIVLMALPDDADSKGEWFQINDIEISKALMEAGQEYSSSFQVKFSFNVDGTAGQISSEDGFTIDDVSFHLIKQDLRMDSIIHPFSNSCGLGTENIEITITNTTDQPVPASTVYYAINGGAAQTTFIGTVPKDTSLNYVLTPPADLTELGNYDLVIWVQSSFDLFSFNDTLRQTILHFPLKEEFPYRESFEDNDGGWLTGGVNSSWQHGKPGKELLSNAAEGNHGWTTGIIQGHHADEFSYLYSPCFDLHGLAQPHLSFAFQYQLETGYDFGWVEYRIEGSLEWIRLGASGQGNNWYTTSSNKWSGTLSEWTTAGIPLPVTDTVLQLRWVMQSDVGVELEGISIDQVHIYDAIEIYQGINMSWTQPVSGNDWVHFDHAGQRIFSIHPQDQDLGNVTLTIFQQTNANELITDSLYLLSRSWLLNSTNPVDNDISIRGYFLESEAVELLQATGCPQCISAQDAFDVTALRYSGINEDGLFTNNNSSGVLTYHPDSAEIFPYQNGYYAEWQSEGLSEWWISTPVTHTNGMLLRQISGAGDDAEEHQENGSVNPFREKLALTEYDGNQKIGWRFRNITIPPHSYIAGAFITWTSSQNQSDVSEWIMRSELSPDASSFTTHKYNISQRAQSPQILQWSPPEWIEDLEYSSPDMRHLIQGIIDQPEWNTGNDISLFLQGDGFREAWSYDGDSSKSALLTIYYAAECTESGVLYVDKNASGLQDGSSWSNAYRSFEQALDRAAHCEDINEIWIAEGIYSPYYDVPRSKAFSIRPGLEIYGGFAGTENSIEERIYGIYPTVLSGDIGLPGDHSDNLYNVLLIQAGSLDVVLDGIIVKNGKADGLLPWEQSGAGIYNQGRLKCNQVILQDNTFPAIYNAPGSKLTSTGLLEIRR